ncbi:hypothetical protein OSH11_20540 [Kaistia dalseonensis]|uniref:Mll4938 protein n=1 Tax=Kaistia dalseonensis TaxID=410840 RepID=A0ABU0HBQ2_9HYPH|nr:hypothetical protein [Kaistia dalseonensis]MCX5497105.1 hypothetical protein [Kaistia dalseonensis]MDQ0439731.1 hypothetical protein [Kaistia dalseonensis]
MNNAAPIPDVYMHIRVIIGIILGLSVSRLLNGLAGFVQHPSSKKIYYTHLIWVVFTLISVLHFWWFEFYLYTVPKWTFELYLFVVFYSSLYFLLCTLLFPDKMDEYSGYSEYFMSRRKWFFGLLATIFIVDVIDTAIKGYEHILSFGFIYPGRNFIFASAAISAIFITNRRYHLAVAIASLFFQTFWILRAFSTLS